MWRFALALPPRPPQPRASRCGGAAVGPIRPPPGGGSLPTAAAACLCQQASRPPLGRLHGVGHAAPRPPGPAAPAAGCTPAEATPAAGVRACVGARLFVRRAGGFVSCVPRAPRRTACGRWRWGAAWPARHPAGSGWPFGRFASLPWGCRPIPRPAGRLRRPASVAGQHVHPADDGQRVLVQVSRRAADVGMP